MAPQRKPRSRHSPHSWAARIRRLQEALGLDNDEMAAKVGIKLRTYNSWKWGERPPSDLALRACKLESLLKSHGL